MEAGGIHYFIGGGRSGPGGDREGNSSRIVDWVEKHYTKETVGGTALYDLTKKKQRAVDDGDQAPT